MGTEAQREGPYVVAAGEVHGGDLRSPRDARVEGVVRGGAEVAGLLEVVGGRVEGAVRCAELRLREGGVVLGPVYVGNPGPRAEPLTSRTAAAEPRPVPEPQDELAGPSGADALAPPGEAPGSRPRGGRPPRVGRVPARWRRRR